MQDQRTKYSTDSTCLKIGKRIISKSYADKLVRQNERRNRNKARKETLRNELKAVKADFFAYRNKAEKKFKEYPKYVQGMRKEFYSTREWRKSRWEVVSRSNGCCSVCGRNNRQHGVILHVDHIKPRSKFPDLELDINNMQVLCEECNIGKGAKKQTF